MKPGTQPPILNRLKFGKPESERSGLSINAEAAKIGSRYLLVAILQLGVFLGCPTRQLEAQEPPIQAEPTTPAKQDDIDGPDGLAGMPEQLQWQDHSPGWNEPGQKLLVTGVIFQPDGKTPASNVVLYYYHTNAEGRYIHRPEVARSMAPNELGQTHGYLRGWVRTGKDGKYAIHTLMPEPYPNDTIAAHIHATIKEPDFKEYYIDDFVFDSDPLVNEEYRQKEENRCGSGILHLERKEDLLIGKRDIILGLNIPDHPAGQDVENNSSNSDGEPAAVTLSVPDVVLDGSNPGIKVAGLKPEEVVRVHVLRSMDKWKEEKGKWQRVRQGLHARADFAAAADGTVDVDTQIPVRGTYAAADPLALLRTGYRLGDPALREVLAVSGDEQTSGSSSQVWVKLEQNGKIVAEADFELNDEAKGIEFEQRSGEG